MVSLIDPPIPHSSPLLPTLCLVRGHKPGERGGRGGGMTPTSNGLQMTGRPRISAGRLWREGGPSFLGPYLAIPSPTGGEGIATPRQKVGKGEGRGKQRVSPPAPNPASFRVHPHPPLTPAHTEKPESPRDPPGAMPPAVSAASEKIQFRPASNPRDAAALSRSYVGRGSRGGTPRPHPPPLLYHPPTSPPPPLWVHESYPSTSPCAQVRTGCKKTHGGKYFRPATS